MIHRLRLLGWFNLLGAVLFVAPVAIGLMLSTVSRPTVQAQFTPRPLAEALAEIDSISDFEKLLQKTLMLERTVNTDTQILAATSRFSDQLMVLLVVSMLVAGLGFLANAGVMMWLLRKQNTEPIAL